MKKWIKILGLPGLLALLGLLGCFLFPAPAYADVGPKPSLTVNARNMPEMTCYLDLLVDYPRKNGYSNIREKSKYDPKMLTVLEQYNEDGWRPAMATGTRIPVSGDIICHVEDGRCSLAFSYSGVPDRFKIIVVSADGRVAVSNIVERRAFDSTVDFDYATGQAVEQAPVLAYFWQFAKACLATLFIEGLMLVLFRFALKANWKPFILINVFTQTILTLSVCYAMFRHGTLAAFLLYLLLEIVILALETALFVSFLQGHSRWRRLVYSLSANTVSFFIGLMMLGLP
jgi:hypothetical protein